MGPGRDRLEAAWIVLPISAFSRMALKFKHPDALAVKREAMEAWRMGR
jgi:hypothetical protein